MTDDIHDRYNNAIQRLLERQASSGPCPFCGGSWSWSAARPETGREAAIRNARDREMDGLSGATNRYRDYSGLQNAYPYAGTGQSGPPPPPPKPLTGWAAWKWLFERQVDAWTEKLHA